MAVRVIACCFSWDAYWLMTRFPWINFALLEITDESLVFDRSSWFLVAELSFLIYLDPPIILFSFFICNLFCYGSWYSWILRTFGWGSTAFFSSTFGGDGFLASCFGDSLISSTTVGSSYLTTGGSFTFFLISSGGWSFNIIEKSSLRFLTEKYFQPSAASISMNYSLLRRL